jgi:DNA-binding MarR family transcriptional regulator
MTVESSKPVGRRKLIAALETAMRQTSGQGVLYSQTVAERLDINSTDLECLDYLAQGPVTAGALAEATGLTTGAITGVVDRLERAGFAERERDAADRRKVVVHARPAVGQRIEPMFAPMQRAMAAALATYSDKELAFLLEFYERIGGAAFTALTALQKQPRPASRKK